MGVKRARDYDAEGRQLNGVYLAMEHLVPVNRECAGDAPSPISAKGTHVVIPDGAAACRRVKHM